MQETIFSRIISGQLDGSFVYKDAFVSAFLDLHPINPGHTLIVPNKPVASLKDLDDETAAHIFNVGRKVAEAIRNTELECEGINLFLSDGEVAGQEVPHVHLHVVPRTASDGFGFKHQAPSFEKAERKQLNEVAETIKKAL